MSSRAHKHAKKPSKPRKSQSLSPVHSSDSEPDPDLELEQDEDQLLHRYQPTSPAQWSHHRHSTNSSLNRTIAPNYPDAGNTSASAAQAQAVPPRRAPIDGLPPELLIQIFRNITEIKYLRSCLLVSSTWCQCTVEHLWLKPQLTSPASLLSFLQVVQPGFSLDAPDSNGERTFDSREVLINGIRRSLDGVQAKGKAIEQLDPHFPYARFVRRLNLSNVADEVQDAHFRCLASCIRMERLTLTGCIQLTDTSLSILSNMHNLVALDLTGVLDVTDKTILIVAASSPKIQGINLEGCKKITDVGVIAISESCPLLRRIKLCELDQITGASLSVLVQKCPLLIEIDLTGCIGTSEAAVRDIWSNSVQLRELRLANCTNVGDGAFPVPAKSSSPPTNTYSQTVTTTFPAQHQAQAASTNETTFRFVPGSLPPLILSKSLSHLRQLDLMSLRITDEVVAGIIANAPRLRYLVLAKCSLLTDNAVRSISELGKSLQFLHLGHANAITDAGIKGLARSCVRLRYVDLACCTSLTNDSVRALCALPKLRRIGLVRVLNLTDEAVEHLTARYNTLERVHLSYCERITVVAIHHLLQKLTKLTHLSLTGVPAFRKKDLQRFCRNPPSTFNEMQREAFCVYSGSGIHDLRRYLERNAPRLQEYSSQPAEDDNDPDLGALHFENGNGNAGGENQASESDEENNDDSTSSPPRPSHTPPQAAHLQTVHPRGLATETSADRRGRGGTSDLLRISRSRANPGTSRVSPSARSGPTASSTTPVAFAGIPTQNGNGTVAGSTMRHRNLAGNVSNAVVGAFMHSRLQVSTVRNGGSATAATGAPPAVANTTASNGGRWVVPVVANNRMETQTRGNALAVPSLHAMSRSRSGGGNPRQGAIPPVTRSSSSTGGRRPPPSSSTFTSAIEQAASASGLIPQENGTVGETNWRSESGRESEMDADESNTRVHRSSPRTNEERKSKSSRREKDREGGTQRSLPAIENAMNEGSRVTTPSPSPTPGVMTPLNGTPTTNGKMKRGIKGTLSAAEHFTVSLFKGKGKSREGSASPGPGPRSGASGGSPREKEY